MVVAWAGEEDEVDVDLEISNLKLFRGKFG